MKTPFCGKVKYTLNFAGGASVCASIEMLIISFPPSFSNDAVNFQSPGLSETIKISSTSELLNTGATIVPLEAKGLPVQVFWAYEAQIDRADNANVSMCLYI